MEQIILVGPVVNSFARLEHPGDEVSFRVPVTLPEFLGGEPGPTRTALIRYRRTGEVQHGFAVFEAQEVEGDNSDG